MQNSDRNTPIGGHSGEHSGKPSGEPSGEQSSLRMNQQQNEQLIERSRAALDASAEQLDYASQLKLQRAREAALAALKPAAKPARRWHQNLLWLAAAPAALAVVLVLPLLLRAPTEPTSLISDQDSLNSFEDMELLAAEADLDTLADIEFYQWLADNPAASDA